MKGPKVMGCKKRRLKVLFRSWEKLPDDSPIRKKFTEEASRLNRAAEEKPTKFAL